MKINKKIILFILVLFLLIFLCIFLYNIIINKLFNEDNAPIFQITKISLYSSAAITDHSPEGLLKDLDIHQFTDIAIQIDNTSYIKDLTAKNTIRELSIYDIRLSTNSTSGAKLLAYKNPLLYGKFEPLSSTDEVINFNILTTNEENNRANYNSPVFFADCSNPISLGYLNLGILTHYNLPDHSRTVSFDGYILKQTDIKMEDLKCNLSFKIKIKNNLDEEFVCEIVLNNIAGDSSIYRGYSFKELTSPLSFVKL